MFKNHVSLSTCHGALHVASLGPLGTHQAITVAWGVNSGQLGIFFKVSRIQNLMCTRAFIDGAMTSAFADRPTAAQSRLSTRVQRGLYRSGDANLDSYSAFSPLRI